MAVFIYPSGGSNQGRDAMANVSLESQIRTLQIIRAALIAGVVSFSVIVLGFISGMPKKLEFGMFEIVLLIVCIQSIGLYFFAPKFMKIDEARQAEIKQLKGEAKEKALMPLVSSCEIIRGAAIEGPSFFALLLVLIADSQVGLIVAGVLIALAIAVFPSSSRIRSAIENIRFRYGL